MGRYCAQAGRICNLWMEGTKDLTPRLRFRTKTATRPLPHLQCAERQRPRSESQVEGALWGRLEVGGWGLEVGYSTA